MQFVQCKSIRNAFQFETYKHFFLTIILFWSLVVYNITILCFNLPICTYCRFDSLKNYDIIVIKNSINPIVVSQQFL